MTNSNRGINRILLALVGIALLAVAAWVILPSVIPSTSIGVVEIGALPDEAVFTTTLLWIIAAIAAVLIVLCVAFILTRGRGRIGQLVDDRGDAGAVAIDARVVADLVSHALSHDLDVVSVHATAYRVRRAPALALRVTARRGADLPRLLDSVSTVVDQLDHVLERKIPVLLHVTSGVRASLAREQRAV